MATESFFSNASLAYLASAGAGKDGKAYSIKPTDGTGDFTFSRGSNLAATRVGADGLIEKGRENLLTYSNDFSNADWISANTTETSGQSGYDGTNDAWLLTSTDTAHSIRQSVSYSGVVCFSVYAKAGTADCIRLRYNASPDRNLYVDLTDGSIVSDSSDIGYNIEPVGTDGWYRLSMISNAISGVDVRFSITDNTGTQVVGTIYIQDAQLEIGLAATDVIESGATTGKAGLLEDEPRFDYSGGATCPSLLLEPSRTNLVKYSEYFGGNLLVNSSIVTNAATSPEGVANATRLIEDTNSGNHALRESENTEIAADDTQYVISFYAKSNGRNIRFIDDGYAGSSTIVNFNITSGGTFSNGSLVIDADAVAFGDGWYYCYAVIGKNASQPRFRFSLRLLGGASNNNDSYTGNGTSGVWIYGKQVEDSVSYPTSYIPNHSGGSVTRGADDAYATGLSSSIGQTEGTLFIEIKPVNSPYLTPEINLNAGGDLANAVRLQFRSNGNVRYYLFANNVNTLISVSESYDDYIKIAITYKSGELKIFINGIERGSTSPLSFPFVGTLDTCENRYPQSVVKQLLIFPTALSDADLTTLTTI